MHAAPAHTEHGLNKSPNPQLRAGDPKIMLHTKQFTHAMWNARLQGVQRNVEVWQALLSVRRLLLDMHEDTATWLKFASLCRKTGRRR